eukprot:gnl/MRDRNA2_/MRDRNA2_200433_c0_seq1.p1 gnl/MRDRNA2_/MRDRNA2_200433_c0~~gnl/MRDRNA2_/MRDRNA2_200433_c0_seq1.p1  ORF type:complete len:540 (+),score=62.00 gnl/MRDRNA2_/MRDRNA2_200433_c0_seq1:55-1674(+)
MRDTYDEQSDDDGVSEETTEDSETTEEDEDARKAQLDAVSKWRACVVRMLWCNAIWCVTVCVTFERLCLRPVTSSFRQNSAKQFRDVFQWKGNYLHAFDSCVQDVRTTILVLSIIWIIMNAFFLLGSCPVKVKHRQRWHDLIMKLFCIMPLAWLLFASLLLVGYLFVLQYIWNKSRFDSTDGYFYHDHNADITSGYHIFLPGAEGGYIQDHPTDQYPKVPRVGRHDFLLPCHGFCARNDSHVFEISHWALVPPHRIEEYCTYTGGPVYTNEPRCSKRKYDPASKQNCRWVFPSTCPGYCLIRVAPHWAKQSDSWHVGEKPIAVHFTWEEFIFDAGHQGAMDKHFRIYSRDKFPVVKCMNDQYCADKSLKSPAGFIPRHLMNYTKANGIGVDGYRFGHHSGFRDSEAREMVRKVVRELQQDLEIDGPINDATVLLPLSDDAQRRAEDWVKGMKKEEESNEKKLPTALIIAKIGVWGALSLLCLNIFLVLRCPAEVIMPGAFRHPVQKDGNHEDHGNKMVPMVSYHEIHASHNEENPAQDH